MTARSDVARDALAGLIAGAALSLARAPLGIDWTQIPAADGLTARLFRAAGLAALALAFVWPLDASRARVRTTVVLWAAASGFAAHGLAAANTVEVWGWMSLAAVCGVAWLALSQLGRGASVTEAMPAVPLELVGLALAGAGCAAAFDSIASTLRLLVPAQPHDDTAFAALFLGLVAFGATAFCGLLAPPRVARLALVIALPLAAAACFESARALEQLSERDGLERFLRSPPWKLSVAHVGQLRGDLLLAARVLIVPALALGAALACVRDRRRLAALLAGAAVEIALVANATLAPARAVALGTTAASLGAALAITLWLDSRSTTRWLGLAACAAIAGGAWLAPSFDATPLSPWELLAPKPAWMRRTSEGLLTVETQRDGSLVATLDRRRLTPLASEMLADAQRVRLVGPAASVLLVGQLTPARARVLAELGAVRIDRTAAWWRSMSRIESELFGSAALEAQGEILSPAQARELAAVGTYDAILVPPIAGASPLVEPPELPVKTRFVAWLDAEAEVAQRHWGDGVMLSSTGVEQLHIGVASAGLADLPPGGALPARTPLDVLAQPRFARARANATRTTERLALGSRGGAGEKLTAGLARHFAVQVESSPFEAPAQQIEIDDEALELLRDAALSAEPTTFVRELWEGLASTLAEKRDVERIDRHVGPLAERWPTWPALERALAIADVELLDPDSAAERLARAIAVAPNAVELRRFRARVLVASSRAPEAVQELALALAADPGRRELARELAMARVRAGEPEGRVEIEALLRADPADAELLPYLATGPLPPPPPAIATTGRHTD